MNHHPTQQPPRVEASSLTPWESSSVRRMVRQALLEHAEDHDLQLTVTDVDDLSRAAVYALHSREIPVPRTTVRVTAMQREVLHGIAVGETAKATGRRLFLSEHTVKTHRRLLFKRLRVQTCGQAVAAGIALGIITPQVQDGAA